MPSKPQFKMARLSFTNSTLHTMFVWVQLLAWLVVVFFATSRRRFRRRPPVMAVAVTPPAEPALAFESGEEP